jgi:hypothetical protein
VFCGIELVKATKSAQFQPLPTNVQNADGRQSPSPSFLNFALKTVGCNNKPRAMGTINLLESIVLKKHNGFEIFVRKDCSKKQLFNALASWNSGDRVCLQKRRSWIRKSGRVNGFTFYAVQKKFITLNKQIKYTLITFMY